MNARTDIYPHDYTSDIVLFPAQIFLGLDMILFPAQISLIWEAVLRAGTAVEFVVLGAESIKVESRVPALDIFMNRFQFLTCCCI